MNIIKKRDFNNELEQLDYFLEQIKQLDYNNTQTFNEMIYMFNNYFSSLSVKIHEIILNYKLDKKLKHIDPDIEEGISICSTIIDSINDYLSESFNKNLKLINIKFNDIPVNFKNYEDDLKKNYDILKITNRNCIIMNFINIINSLKYYFKKQFNKGEQSNDCYI
jgi:hypothetical protein